MSCRTVYVWSAVASVIWRTVPTLKVTLRREPCWVPPAESRILPKLFHGPLGTAALRVTGLFRVPGGQGSGSMDCIGAAYLSRDLAIGPWMGRISGGGQPVDSHATPWMAGPAEG